MICAKRINTPVGGMWIESNENAIIRIHPNKSEKSIESENQLLFLAELQLREYFELKRRSFSFPIQLYGTPFQKLVWSELVNIPYGETRAYKEIAQAIGRPNAVRAVGNACNKNHMLFAVPCHRVIRSNGSIDGFELGTHIKKQLLDLEYCLINRKNMV